MSDTIRTFRGDTSTHRVTCTNADGSAYDLSGLDVTFTVRATVEDEAVTIEKTIDDGLSIVDDPEAGLLDLALVPSDTASLLGDYRYDVEASLGDTVVHTLAAGVFVVLADLTHSTGS